MKDPGLSDRICRSGAGYRNNNPGNRTGKDSVFGAGTDPSGSHTWTRYANWVNGYAGNCLLLLKYLDGEKKSKYGLGERNPCMISVIYTWCPPGDGNNNSAKYVEQMCNWCGIEPDDKIAITEQNLIYLELAKGCKDSGCVQRKACEEGVRMAIDYYKSHGGHLDSNTNLGKVESDVVRKIKQGDAITTGGTNGGGSSGGSYTSSGSSTTTDAMYTNGNGAFSGSSWGEPKQCGEISSANYVNKPGRASGVVVGTHIRQN